MRIFDSKKTVLIILYRRKPIMAVGTNENASCLRSFALKNCLKYINTTAKIAPTWINTSKNLRNSVCCSPISRAPIIIWAVEEMGKNSVMPSITPRRAACIIVIGELYPFAFKL